MNSTFLFYFKKISCVLQIYNKLFFNIKFKCFSFINSIKNIVKNIIKSSKQLY